MLTAGCDLGSTTAKAVLLEDGRVCASAVIPTITSPERAAQTVLQLALEQSGVSSLACIDSLMTTGYGRLQVPFADGNTSEITAHAKGAHWLRPEIRTILDIGGQDCKAIALSPQGRVLEFSMNDKCAAGTGRFLENMARIFGVSIAEFAKMALQSTKPVAISSQCSVFAESEVVTLINAGENLNDIAAGLHDSVAGRLTTLLRRAGLQTPLTMTGGGAKNGALVRAVEQRTGETVMALSFDTQLCGALGAAVLAAEKLGQRFSEDAPHG